MKNPRSVKNLLNETLASKMIRRHLCVDGLYCLFR